jgi:glycopeptide antibiotics resistance protein
MAGILYAASLFFAWQGTAAMTVNALMYDIYFFVLIGSLVGVPLILATWLMVSSMPDKRQRYKIMRGFVFFLFAFYILVIGNMLLRIRLGSGGITFPFIDLVKENGLSKMLKLNTNLVPGHSIRLYIRAYQNGTLSNREILANLAGNLVLFIPMGLFLPDLFVWMRRLLPFLVVMTLILIGVEVSQLLMMTGSLDVDDIILNLAGALLGYLVWHWRPTQAFFKKIYLMPETT